MKKQKNTVTPEVTVDVVTGETVTSASPVEEKKAKKAEFSLIMDALFSDVETEVTYVEPSLGSVVHGMAMVNGKEYIHNLTAETAKQNIFTVNRRLAINYPIQTQLFNIPKVNALDELKFWSDYLYAGGKPGWIYTSGVSKSSSEVKSTKKYSNADMKRYADAHDISMKDLITAEKFFPEDTAKEIIAYKKYIESINKSE